MNRVFRSHITIFSLCLLLCMPATAPAADKNWINPGTGQWMVDSNWDSAPYPSTGDNARINNGGVSQVVAGQSVSVDDLTIGNSAGGSGALAVSGGGEASADYIYIGNASGSVGAAGVDGTSSRLSAAVISTLALPATAH